MVENPLVSIIVPTKNSQVTLRGLLESIKRQTYKNIETIVVDNFSIDETVKIAKEMGVVVIRIGPERSSQLNMGCQHARGKYIYFIGSDHILDANLMEEAVKLSEMEKLDAVIINNVSDPTISFWSRVRNLERSCFEDDLLNSVTRFFRKDVFVKLGGWDENLVAGEDYDLQNRLLQANYRVGILRPDVKELHIGEPKSLIEIVRKFYYYGTTFRKFVEKNPTRAIQQLSPFRPSYWRHRDRFLRNPKLTLGLVVYQFVKYLASAVGYFRAQIGSIKPVSKGD